MLEADNRGISDCDGNAAAGQITVCESLRRRVTIVTKRDYLSGHCSKYVITDRITE